MLRQPWPPAPRCGAVAQHDLEVADSGGQRPAEVPAWRAAEQASGVPRPAVGGTRTDRTEGPDPPELPNDLKHHWASVLCPSVHGAEHPARTDGRRQPQRRFDLDRCAASDSRLHPLARETPSARARIQHPSNVGIDELRQQGFAFAEHQLDIGSRPRLDANLSNDARSQPLRV